MKASPDMILTSDDIIEELEVIEEAIPCIEDVKPRRESKNHQKSVEVRRKIEDYLELRRMKEDFALEEEES